jgi:arabinose-5-phosphate isomerase
MTSNILALAQQTLKIESDAINNLSLNLAKNECFEKAIDLLLKCNGKVVLIGMGKSGHIANKIAATLASTGTSSFFVHPAEASHGDLGMIQENDVVILLSNSGETAEVICLLPALKRKKIKLISITGNSNSTLSKVADINIDAVVKQEACPHNLAPTTSTTVALALGDAIAICLLDAKGFSPDDFAISHPAGSLGRRLLTRVKDIMRVEAKIPMVDIHANLADALMEMTQKGLGMTSIVNNFEDKKILGIFTDGDLRRLINTSKSFADIKIIDVMKASPKTVVASQMAVEALNIMESHAINQMLVIDSLENNILVGAFNMQDLLLAKIV